MSFYFHAREVHIAYIPGDIAILLHTGLSMKKSLCYNFLAALTIVLGLIIGIILGENTNANMWIFAVAGGMFLYISLVDMVCVWYYQTRVVKPNVQLLLVRFMSCLVSSACFIQWVECLWTKHEPWKRLFFYVTIWPKTFCRRTFVHHCWSLCWSHRSWSYLRRAGLILVRSTGSLVRYKGWNGWTHTCIPTIDKIKCCVKTRACWSMSVT